MVLIGGLLLGIGLMTALRSNRYENRAMGEAARMGIITFAPEENQGFLIKTLLEISI